MIPGTAVFVVQPSLDIPELQRWLYRKHGGRVHVGNKTPENVIVSNVQDRGAFPIFSGLI